jgi:hypothetical protein
MIRIMIDIKYSRETNTAANIDQSGCDHLGLNDFSSLWNRYLSDRSDRCDFSIDANDRTIGDCFSRNSMNLLGFDNEGLAPNWARHQETQNE